MSKSFGQIIRRYATALYEIAVEEKQLVEIRVEANLLISVLDKPVLDFFVSPLFDVERKNEILALLAEKAKLSKTVSMFFTLLLKNGRMAVATQILKSFINQAEESLKIARIEIITTQPLEGSELKSIVDALTSTLKRTIEISQSIDSGLKAGSIIKIGNTIVDASLRTRLANLKDSLSVGV